MLKPVFQNPWVRALGLLLALTLLVFLAYLLRPVLIPLLIAFTVAYILDPVVDFFESRKIRRPLGIAIIAFTAVIVLTVIPLYVVPNLLVEARDLAQAATARSLEAAGEGRLDRAIDGAVDWLPIDEFVIAVGWAERPGETEVADAETPEETPPAQTTPADSQSETDPDSEEPTPPPSGPRDDIDSVAIIGEHIAQWVQENAVRLFRANAPQLLNAGQQVGLGLGQVLSILGQNIVSFILFVANFALFAFVAFYLLKDFDAVISAGAELVPPRHREKTYDIFRKIDAQLRAFMRGQFLVMLCLGVMYAIGLTLTKTPFGIVIGLMGGVASFVPYLGLALTIGPAVILSLLQHGFDGHVFGVLAVFLVAQLLEGTVLTPKIVGEQVGLGPVWVILAIMVFSTALGFLGLLLAVPLAATIKVLVVEALAYYRTSPIFEGGGGSSGGGSSS